MDLFLQIILSFPTVFFSILLAVAVAYWLLAMIGMMELDSLTVGLGADGSELETGAFPGLLMKFGLDGFPLALIITGIALIGWVISFFADLYLLREMAPGPMFYLLGAAVGLGAFVLSIPLTGLAIHPLKPLFARVEAVTSESLLGRVAIVRSPVVTPSEGSAALDDGGAGLILQVRAEAGELVRGNSVILVEYVAASNAYRVIGTRPVT